jgi:hypothetical protein
LATGDFSGDGTSDWAAGVETGFAEGFSGAGAPTGLARPVPAFARAPRRLSGATPLFGRPGAAPAYDGRGRAVVPAPGAAPRGDLPRGRR